MTLDDLEWYQVFGMRFADLPDNLVIFHNMPSNTYTIYRKGSQHGGIAVRVDALTAMCIVTEILAGRYPSSNPGGNHPGGDDEA